MELADNLEILKVIIYVYSNAEPIYYQIRIENKVRKK